MCLTPCSTRAGTASPGRQARAQSALLLDALVARAAEEQPGRGLDPGKRPIAGKALHDTLDTAFEAADRRRAALWSPSIF